MSSEKKCCVPGCPENSDSGNVLHLFPNPEKDLARFMAWVSTIGGDILKYSNEYIYKNRRVCHAHFEFKYCCRYNRISNIALPTLYLPGLKLHVFPNPELDLERFKTWITIVKSYLKTPDDYKFYITKRICDKHFTEDCKLRNNRISVDAVPTLCLLLLPDPKPAESQPPEPSRPASPTDSHTNATDISECDSSVLGHDNDSVVSVQPPEYVEIPGVPFEEENTKIVHKLIHCQKIDGNLELNVAEVTENASVTENKPNEDKTTIQGRTTQHITTGQDTDKPTADKNDDEAEILTEHNDDGDDVDANVALDQEEDKSRPVLHHIGFLKQKLNSVLCSHRFCTLCFDMNKSLKSFEEQIIIKTDNWTQTTQFKHLYSYVFNQKAEESACGYICTDCSVQLQQSYIFIKNSKLTRQLLESYIDDLKIKSFDMVSQLDEIGPIKINNSVIHLESHLVDKYYTKNIREDNDKTDKNTHQKERFLHDHTYELSRKISDECDADCICLKCKKNTSLKCFEETQAKTTDTCKVEDIMDVTEMIPDEMDVADTVTVEMAVTKTVKTKNTCEICSKKFNSDRSLPKHYTMVHLKVQCKICRTLVDECDIQQHLTTEHRNGAYFCEICDRPFYSPESVTVHTKIVHEKDDLTECVCSSALKTLHPGECHDPDKHLATHACSECSECGMKCIHKKYLYSYIEQTLNHASTKTKCPDCDYICREKDQIIIHANKAHLNHRPHICDQCGQQFYDKYSLANHIRTYHMNVSICKYCDKKFNSSDMLSIHETYCGTKQRAHSCEHCAASFNTFELLQKHHNRRHKEVFPCKFCNKVFLKEAVRRNHVARTHSGVQKTRNPRKWACKLCHDVFDLSNELKNHMLSHRGPDAKHHCKLCNTEFESLETLKSHNKSNHVGLLSVCNKCGKQVKEGLLQKHLEEHKLDVEANCDECGKLFTNIIKLKQHIKIRHRIPMQCKLCHYATLKSAALDAHMNRVHSNIKPYVCHLCGQQFYGKYSLTNHIAVCQNRPRCTICGKEFASKKGLKKHSFIHTRVKKFRDLKALHKLNKHAEKSILCPKCPMTFFTVGNLKRHIVKFH